MTGEHSFSAHVHSKGTRSQVQIFHKCGVRARQTLADITPEDCERWKRWLRNEKRHAEATASKHIKRAKTLFAAAVNDRLLTASPFQKVKTGSEANDQRHYELTADVAADVLAACPDDDWRVIFGVARYGGLRCPREVLTLKWSDVLWDQKKLRIDSPKTGLRFCPIFPDLAPILEAAFDAAPDERNSSDNIRTM